MEELCGLVFVNLDPDAAPLADLVGDLPARLERYRIPTLESFAAVRRLAAGELEGRRRELPRGLPHPDRASRPDADARLQALRRRAARALRVVRGAAPRTSRAATGSSGSTRSLVTPDAGSGRGATATSGATCSSTRTRRSTSIPTRSTPGRCCPTGSRARATSSARYRAARRRPAHARSCSASTSGCNTLVLDEDIDLVDNVQRGLRRAATGAARCRARESGGGVVRRPHPR